MKNVTRPIFLTFIFIFLVLVGVGSALAATSGPASQYKIKGTFDIPKKEYKVGETVRGKFTVLNQERDMTIDIQRSERGKLIYIKKMAKVKKGGRLTIPVEWKVEKPGKQTIQYMVNGSWPEGKKVKGFSRTFEHVINAHVKQAPSQEQLSLPVFLPLSLEAAPTAGVKRCNSIDCLIELARSCNKGEFAYTSLSPFPFDEEMTVNARGYYKIQGKDTNGACTFLSQSRGADITLSQKGRKAARQRGLADAAIDAQIKTMRDSMNSEEAIKSVTTCTGTTANVSTFFINTKQGSADSPCTIQLGSKETRCTVEPNLSCITRMP